MNVPSISRFASSFCLSLSVKLRFPVEYEDCMVLAGESTGRRDNGALIEVQWLVHVTRVSRQPDMTLISKLQTV